MYIFYVIVAKNGFKTSQFNYTIVLQTGSIPGVVMYFDESLTHFRETGLINF